MREAELTPALISIGTSQPQGLCKAKAILLCPGHKAFLREPGERGENICYQKLMPSHAKTILTKTEYLFLSTQ